MSNEYIVETKELTKIYGTGDAEVKALDCVNFNVKSGEFVSVTGPSGSGKSTLLHIIGAVDSPTIGKVSVDGTDVFSQKSKQLAQYRRQKIGLIFQFYNLIPVLSAEENITLPLKLDGQKVDKDFLNEIIETIGLTERKNNFPHQLSGGQQQRVAIARALIAKPSIILADEPTGNLDSKNGVEVLELLKSSCKKYGQTLILVTHDNNIAKTADREIIMRDGKITEA